MWWTSAVVVDLPLVPVMPTTLCDGRSRAPLRRGSISPITGTPKLSACGLIAGIERNAGADDNAREAGEVRLDRIGQFDAIRKLGARLLASVPRHDLRAARQQRLDRRPAGPREAEHRVALSFQAVDVIIAASASPGPSARMIETIQKRITTLLSLQPSCSKW